VPSVAHTRSVAKIVIGSPLRFMSAVLVFAPGHDSGSGSLILPLAPDSGVQSPAYFPDLIVGELACGLSCWHSLAQVSRVNASVRSMWRPCELESRETTPTLRPHHQVRHDGRLESRTFVPLRFSRKKLGIGRHATAASSRSRVTTSR
jgi:hypothetical protein